MTVAQGSAGRPDETTLVVRIGAPVEAEVDGELVALDVESGTCYGLNSTATRIWRLLERPLTFGQLLDELTRAYDVPREQCGSEVTALLREMEADKLVELRVPPTGV
jgi:hypothetical protein